MTDMSGHGRPQQDSDQLRHTLTISQVGTRLAAAGVPRSERQIKRYCETGFLDAKKIPGPSGEQWFVAPAALPKLIGDLQQWQMQRAGHDRLGPTTSDNVRPEKQHDGGADTAGHGRPQQAMTDQQTPDEGAGETEVSHQVARLEREVEQLVEDRQFLREQIKVKDGQIASLLERDRETNILIRGLQEMLTPLLGTPRYEPPIRETSSE
jgi:hypothetical protein